MNQTVPLVQRFNKRNLKEFLEEVSGLAIQIAATDQIELNAMGRELGLCEEDERILRAFTRRQGGVCIGLEPLSGGLSGARVLLGKVIDNNGNERLTVACKLGTSEAIDDEISRYGHDIVRLVAGTYPTLIPGEPISARGRRGAFYRFLEGYGSSLFDVLGNSEDTAVSAVRRLETPWTNAFTGRLVLVKCILHKLIKPRKLPAIRPYLDGLGWEVFEERPINVNECTRHGDLHGENVRSTANGQVTIIDFGEVDVFPSAIDAVSLELSTFFHPNGPGRENPPLDAGVSWHNVEEFADKTPYPRFTIAGVPILGAFRTGGVLRERGYLLSNYIVPKNCQRSRS